jgi:hypothetical protein
MMNDDELLEFGRERIDLLGDVRKQPGLPTDPATHISHGIVAHGPPPRPIETMN